jgi:UDP-N-acetylglucosamine 2-epimerase (non-hydrolysing)
MFAGVLGAAKAVPNMRPVPASRTVLSVVGARPNFMKMAPIIAELQRHPEEFSSVLVHTGQHYDATMSEVFLDELGVGVPDHVLGVGSGSHAQQTARVMERLEAVLFQVEPDIVLVPGDVNSTLAASLVACKLGIPVGHVEAGLRSFDRTMPEEINRMVADSVSELLFVHSPEAIDNLRREGIAADKIHRVGNTMIDTLVAMSERIDGLDAASSLGLTRGEYMVVTLHRPALVDGPLLFEAMDALDQVSEHLPVVFPVHPRTRAALNTASWKPDNAELRLTDPIGYFEFLSLVKDAAGVLTDSGGIQEETTFLRIPCFTLRANSERPITCTVGTNTLLGLEPDRILDIPDLLRGTGSRTTDIPDGWDGHAAGRIVDVLVRTELARAPVSL